MTVLTGFVRLGVPLDFFGRDVHDMAGALQDRHPNGWTGDRGQSIRKLMKRSMRGEFDLAFFKQETGQRTAPVALRSVNNWSGSAGPNYSGDDNQVGAADLIPKAAPIVASPSPALEGPYAGMASQFRQPEL